MRVSLLCLLGLLFTACQHTQRTPSVPQRFGPVSHASSLSPCMTFLEALNSMNGKELKAENERWQKNSNDKKTDDDIRASIAAGIYQARNKNYGRAYEILSPLSNRKSLDEGCRVSLRLYSEALGDTLQLDRDLLAEKKLKDELDRKIKGLSEIEKDISKRDGKAHGL